jgi:hypothetical protein
MKEVIIDKRFCGPRRSANGGYAAGVFAEAAGGGARQVTLKSPPPLNEPIAIRDIGDDVFEAMHGDVPVARIEPGDVVIDENIVPPSDEDVAKAHDNYLGDEEGSHMLPWCFVCGINREPGDGLRIFSGPAPGSPINADFWTPDESLVGKDGLVRPEFLWAALDCPSAFALRNGLRLSLLGRFTAKVMRRPKPGERLVAAAWRTGEEGRKHFSSSALFDRDGKQVAGANAVWIELNDLAFLEKLKAENA